MAARAVCGAALRDGSLCRAAALKDWDGRCEHHGLIAEGEARGWQVRGSRRTGLYVAQRGAERLIATSAKELLALIVGDAAEVAA